MPIPVNKRTLILLVSMLMIGCIAYAEESKLATIIVMVATGGESANTAESG